MPAQARVEASRHGPCAQETLFSFKTSESNSRRRGGIHIVVAQYNDQGLIPVQYLGSIWPSYHIGLPFVRTRVDHGNRRSRRAECFDTWQPCGKAHRRTVRDPPQPCGPLAGAAYLGSSVPDLRPLARPDTPPGGGRERRRQMIGLTLYAAPNTGIHFHLTPKLTSPFQTRASRERTAKIKVFP